MGNGKRKTTSGEEKKSRGGWGRGKAYGRNTYEARVRTMGEPRPAKTGDELKKGERGQGGGCGEGRSIEEYLQSELGLRRDGAEGCLCGGGM